MSGPIAVRSFMRDDNDLVALVDTRMVADDVLPQGTTLPALLIKSISLIDRNIPNPGAMQHVRERVRVEGHCATARERRALMLAVRRAAFANRFPTVDGLSRVTVHPEAGGPDGIGDASVRVGIQDLILTYSQSR